MVSYGKMVCFRAYNKKARRSGEVCAMKIPKARKLPSGGWSIQLRLGGECVTVTASTEKQCEAEARYVKSEYMLNRRVDKIVRAGVG